MTFASAPGYSQWAWRRSDSGPGRCEWEDAPVAGCCPYLVLMPEAPRSIAMQDCGIHRSARDSMGYPSSVLLLPSADRHSITHPRQGGASTASLGIVSRITPGEPSAPRFTAVRGSC